MSEGSRLLADPVLLRLGLALAHFVWQGAALAAVAGLALTGLRKAHPGKRYLALLAVLAAMVACPVMTFARVTPPNLSVVSTRIAVARFAAAYAGPAGQSAASAAAERPTPPTDLPRAPLGKRVSASAQSGWQWLQPRLSWAVLAWALGVLLLSVRLLLRWRGLDAVRRGGQPLPGERWTEALARLCETVRVPRAVLLLQSSLARVPTTAGWLRPVVLLPVSALMGLTPRQLEAVVAHELAHIRRYDYLVNLLQTMLETLLFYHPAVWWVSGRIRLEREQCCDEIAIAACGNARTYAGALMQLAHAQSLPLALAATDGLSARLHRLAGSRSRGHDFASLVGALAPALAVIGLMLGARVPAAGHIAQRLITGGTEEFAICTARADQLSPAVSGDIVVWTDYRNDPNWRVRSEGQSEDHGATNADIYAYDVRTKREFAVCTARGMQVDPAIDGNIIVWEDHRDDPGGDIYGYDLITKKEFPICALTGNQDKPRIAGDLVVWEDGRTWGSTLMDIWGCTLSDGREFPICTAAGDQVSPDVSGTIVVWRDCRHDPDGAWTGNSSDNADIYARDLASGAEIALCTNPFDQGDPSVSGSTVAWGDLRSNGRGPEVLNPDIYAYDLILKREFVVCTDLSDEHCPTVSGNVLVYYTGGRLAAFDLSTGVTTVLPLHSTAALQSPNAVSGDLVVWEDARHRARSGIDIYAYRLPARPTRE